MTEERDEMQPLKGQNLPDQSKTTQRRELQSECEISYRGIIDSFSEAVYVLDKQGRIMDVNKGAERMYGYTRQEMIGMSPADVSAPGKNDLVLVLEKCQRAYAGEPQEMEFWGLAKDGHIFPKELHGYPGEYFGEKVVVVIAQDITERKAAEEALRESEEKYRSVVENIGIGIAMISPEMEILSLNRQMQEWFTDICIGKQDYVCFKAFNNPPRESVCSYCPVVKTLQDGRVHEAVTETPAGEETINFRIVASPVFDKSGKVMAVIEMVENVTDRVKTEDALRQSEATYRGIIDSFSEAVYILDENCIFIDVNKGAERMYGYTRDELIGMSPASVSAPGLNDLADVLEKCRLAFSGEPQEIAFWGMAKDGRIFPKEVHAYQGEYFGKKVIVAIAQNITERKAAEEALRESEELYRLLTELSPSSITVADPSGIIRMLNATSLSLFGHEHESEVVGRSMFEWVAKESHAAVYKAMQDLFIKDSVTGLKLTFLRRDGSSFHGEVNASLLRNSQGEPRLIIIVTSDDTQKRQAEEERLKLQKLEAIGTLAGGIAHDFNNLLQGVFGYISMARLKMHDQQKAEAMLDQAEKALSMSVNLTSQLLTFAKGGKPSKKNISLKPVIENSAGFVLSGSRLDYRLTVAGDIWNAEVDEGQIGQVIQNIVLTASEAMPDGGTVEIDAKNIVLAAEEKAALPEGGKFIKIHIRDFGIGIPEQYLSKIFDPYFTTKQKGSGLGLATSYSIIKNHGGAIEVTSGIGGSSFSIYLPAAEYEKDNSHCPAASSGRRCRLLVMDDEEMVRNIVSEMLETLGHEPECAVDGDEAIAKFEHARQSGRPYDVVILDLTVKGGMGGEAAIKKIRQIDPAVIAVVSSGYADSPVIADYQSHGFSAFLNKPYRIEALRDCLNGLPKGK